MHLLSHRHMHNLKKKVNLVFKVWHLYSYRAHKEISSRGSSQRAEQKWPGAGRAAPTPCRNWLCLLSMHLRRYTSSTIEDGQDRRTLQELATGNASRAREMKIQTRVSGVLLQETKTERSKKAIWPHPVYQYLFQSAAATILSSCGRLSSLSLTNIHFLKATYLGSDHFLPQMRPL